MKNISKIAKLRPSVSESKKTNDFLNESFFKKKVFDGVFFEKIKPVTEEKCESEYRESIISSVFCNFRSIILLMKRSETKFSLQNSESLSVNFSTEILMK